MAGKAERKVLDKIIGKVDGMTPGQQEIWHEMMQGEKIGRKNLSEEDLLELAQQVKNLFPNK